MIDSQLFEPEYLNRFVTEAYTNSAGNTEYLQILTDLRQYQDSQDIFLNSLTYENLSDHTIIYIIKSLCTIFNQNKSFICRYSPVFADFYINRFAKFPKTPIIISLLSNLFVIIFKSDREQAINIIKNINDSFLKGILSSCFTASTNSMKGLSKSFKTVLLSFSEQTKFKSNQNFVLFSKMLSSFNDENIPSKLIDLIIQIGGPKMLLNSISLMNEQDSIEFLKSLEKIIKLPVMSFKTNQVRLNYFIDFIEGTVNLLKMQTNKKIISQLSFIMIDLRDHNSIRSLRNIEFVSKWIEEIFQITINCLNSEYLKSFPYCIENWMHFWSLTYDFQIFRENSEFKMFALGLIENVVSATIPFLIENSSLICENFILNDESSNFFEYLSKVCQINYSMITHMISENFETDKIEEVLWHIEFGNRLIEFHSKLPDLLNYIDDDLKLMESFRDISSNISVNLHHEFEYLLISFYQSFLYCYGLKESETFVKFFNEKSSIFLYYLNRIIDNLSIPELPIKSIQLFVKSFDFKLYHNILIDRIVDDKKIIQKVIELDFPFWNEKDKKKETIEFYGYFFSLLQHNSILLPQMIDSLLSKMNSLDLVPYVLNIYGHLFELLEKNVEYVYIHYFKQFLPIISNLVKMENESQNMNVYRHLAKVLSIIANANEKRHHFKFMSIQILNLFKSTLELLSILLKNSDFDDKIMHFSILSVNSFIKNNSLNIGIMMSYEDFTFNQFISEFFDVLKSKEEICNKKFLFDLVNFFELLVQDFDILQQPYFDFFFFFLNEIIIKGIKFLPKKALAKSVPILNRSLNFFENLKGKNDECLKCLLASLLEILPGLRLREIDYCLFCLFILEKNDVTEIVGSLVSDFLNKQKFEWLMDNLKELLNSNSPLSDDNQSESHKIFTKILEYIKESVIIRRLQPIMQ